ncbi:hypothetical protein [Tropicimonas marinistellae]|uniref:hypothetical protein n=1 Tax=Tropicimonas marinistellae TaxID=1739787 RepID=UPI00082A03FA|nr:hypothetical protein [Tropicimonas marinistellae]
MKAQHVAGLLAVLLLAGCESSYNPANWGWFGRSQSTPTLAPSDGYEDTTDIRPLVSQVVSMRIERAPGGAIVTAVGLPPTQGYWAADLLSTYVDVVGDVAANNGEILLEFRIVPPRAPQPAINAQSREVTAGIFLSDQTLQGVRTVTVVGQNNRRSSRR